MLQKENASIGIGTKVLRLKNFGFTFHSQAG
jgi:hypothetical protein